MNEYDKNDVPQGFGMALSKNIKAMKRFAMMSDDERDRVIKATQTINSKTAMQTYVDELGRFE